MLLSADAAVQRQYVHSDVVLDVMQRLPSSCLRCLLSSSASSSRNQQQQPSTCDDVEQQRPIALPQAPDALSLDHTDSQRSGQLSSPPPAPQLTGDTESDSRGLSSVTEMGNSPLSSSSWSSQLKFSICAILSSEFSSKSSRPG